eukprot:510933-Alexandrium_andersonii.AAC.1
MPAPGPEPPSVEPGPPLEASTGGPRTERMPMPTEPTYKQRMQALPTVPRFGPGQAGFTPPFRGSVAAATPIAAPRGKAKLLSWKDVEEKRRRCLLYTSPSPRD